MKPTDVEISRALNALSTTLRDQRPPRFDTARVEQIVSGAMAGEHKLRARATGPDSGELLIAGEQTLVAVVELADGRWKLERKPGAGDSS